VRDESVGLGIGMGVLSAIFVAGLLVPIRDWLGASNVALVLAIVVVVAAIVGGRLAGAATSVAAALAFDFFHTRPYYTLRIDKREDVIAAVLLLVLGIIVGQLGVLRAGSRREAALNAMAAKRLEAYTALLRKGGWRDGKGLPQVMKGERLGIIGFGEIGRMVGEVGKALGMELVAWSPHMTPERAATGGAKSVTLEELLKTSKVVTLHLVPSEETRKLLNAERLAMMRPDSILANTARSALIDMKALDEALAKGRPGFAALDVYDDEPLAPGYALAKRDNVVLSPHLGFVNDSSFEKFATGSVENLVNWLEGRPLVRVQTG